MHEKVYFENKQKDQLNYVRPPKIKFLKWIISNKQKKHNLLCGLRTLLSSSTSPGSIDLGSIVDAGFLTP